MVNISFLQPTGTEVSVAADGSDNVMHAAVQSGIDGIIGECGGELSCATCHVYVDEATHAKLPPIGDDESDLLEFVDGVQERSRLSCQIAVNQTIDGATFEIVDSYA